MVLRCTRGFDAPCTSAEGQFRRVCVVGYRSGDRTLTFPYN
ncbi:hypothetical protein C3B79_1099 [Aeromonas hydrophila]|nr:hypothetical protein C3B79_1099 [Aeromonas hydrophila]